MGNVNSNINHFSDKETFGLESLDLTSFYKDMTKVLRLILTLCIHLYCWVKLPLSGPILCSIFLTPILKFL